MRNKIVFLIIMSILILGGCRTMSSGRAETETTAGENGTVTAKSKITTEESEMETSKQEITTAEPITEHVEAEYEINLTGYPLYDELIGKIMSIYYTSEDKQADFSDLGLAYSYVFGRFKESYGYALMDLDGDGVEELLLGDTEFNEHINNIFTIKDNELLLVYAKDSPKECAYLSSDNIFWTVFSYTGESWWCNYYNHMDGKLNIIESVGEVYDWDSEDIYDLYFYHETGGGDEIIITEDEANAVKDKFDIIEINYTPLIKSVVQ